VQVIRVSTSLSLALLVAGVGSAAAQPANCRADLIKADQGIHRSLDTVQKAKNAAATVKCAAFRQHIAALNGVKAVMARCDTGPNKAANAAQTNSAIATFAKEMREACPSGGGAPVKKN
jgi:hypothetical protein